MPQSLGIARVRGTSQNRRISKNRRFREKFAPRPPRRIARFKYPHEESSASQRKPQEFPNKERPRVPEQPQRHPSCTQDALLHRKTRTRNIPARGLRCGAQRVRDKLNVQRAKAFERPIPARQVEYVVNECLGETQLHCSSGTRSNAERGT